MSNWSRKILVIFTLLGLTGGQWALLQSAAWAGMLVSHLRTDSLPSAISQTFDGKHLCPLCKAIQQGKKSENKSEAVTKVTRMEFPPMQAHCQIIANLPLESAANQIDEIADSLSTAPPVRPPRTILV